jgi:hypothetical protein
MELYTLLYLSGKGLVGGAVARMEGSVVAVSATASAHAAVPVGASETSVQHQLLQAVPILGPEMVHVRIIALFHGSKLVFVVIFVNSMRRFFPFALCLLALSFYAGAQTRAVVEFSVATLHRSADYESPVESQCLMGSTVVIDGQDGYWRNVQALDPPYKGWTEELSIVEMTQAQYDAWLEAPKYICNAVITHIYESPLAGSRYISDIAMGGVVRQVLDAKGKAVRRGRWLQVALPSGRRGWMLRSQVQDYATWLATRSATAQNVISTAEKFLGSPYMWGGNSTKGVDCSGLTWMAFHMNGIELPRDTSQQVKEGEEVNLDDAVPGDLIFFGTPATENSRERTSHVAIYLGDGRILHSSQVVRISSLDPDSPDYYQHRPILHVRRIIQ